MSSIPPDSLWRGCAAAFPQPIDEDIERAAQCLVETVYFFNCRVANPPLPDIIYRSSERERDVTRHVFRWDTTPYQQVFEHGFEARRQEGTPDATYFDLNHYVHHGGRPLNSTRPTTSAFVSTTLNSQWRPNPSEATLPPGGEMRVYRYEIYAPGGIWVNETLGELYQYPRQNEVAFASSIAPQYIRSAQSFIGTRTAANPSYVNWRREDQRIIVNGNFNPQSHPSRMLDIQRPVFDYREGARRPPLTIVIFRRGLNDDESRPRRDVSRQDPADWYAGAVADSESYINAAFRASSSNEVYLFMKNEYVLLNYAPGSTDDRIVNGPLLICDGYPSLAGTPFGEHGIDCAFDSHRGNQAFIFSGNLCARIDYAPGTTDDKILDGPRTITAMFPFFNRTVFASSIDAAFTATSTYEAYLFKGDSYALINYESKTLIAIRKIAEGFPSWRNTIFESGVEAAFASHRTDEAYIFKGDKYALINFAPGTTDDYIIGGVKPIAPNWPSLRGILPRKNRGLDDHDHHGQALPHRNHDVHDKL